MVTQTLDNPVVIKQQQIDLGIVGVDFEDKQILNAIREKLVERFPTLNVVIDLTSGLKLSNMSLCKYRSKISGLSILNALSLEYPEMTRIIGVTGHDLYTPGLSYIFGLARLHGRESVVSIARLTPKSCRNSRLTTIRAQKTVVHEVAHLIGLDHCNDNRCVMWLSDGVRDTDRKSDNFCWFCQKELDRNLARLKS